MRLVVAALMMLPVVAAAQMPAGATLAAVKARGMLNCPTSGASPGFGIFDKRGWTIGGRTT